MFLLQLAFPRLRRYHKHMGSRFIAIALALGLAPAASAQTSVGQIFSSEATVEGSVQLAAGGARVMSGSSVSAGDDTALLKLDRGGDLRVCPHTTVSVSTSSSGRDLMIGMSTGAVEARYALAASADIIMTPDFRILLPGPGMFDFAIGADPNGAMCVRAMPNNSASLIVTELMGDGTYQVKPDEQVVFNDGRVDSPGHDAQSCGCPAAPTVLQAAKPPLPPLPETTHSVAPPPAIVPEPAPGGEEVHVQVDAPFIFRATEPGPSPLEEGVHLHVASSPPVNITPQPPKPPETAQLVKPNGAQVETHQAGMKKFFGKLRKFFATIFR